MTRGKLVVVGVLLAIALGWLGWNRRGWDYKNLPPRAQGGWVAFGDSLTEGFGAGSGNDYPTQLGKRIGVSIQNLGVSGETSGDGLLRLPQVEEMEPRVALVCFGGNDVLRNVSRDVMIRNVGQIVDRLQARGTFVVLIGVRGASLVGDRNAAAFKRLAREKGAFYVPDILDEVFSNPAMMSDYIHPNEAGYGQIAERIERLLHPVLARLK